MRYSFLNILCTESFFSGLFSFYGTFYPVEPGILHNTNPYGCFSNDQLSFPDFLIENERFKRQEEHLIKGNYNDNFCFSTLAHC
jgi:hypothetical protein